MTDPAHPHNIEAEQAVLGAIFVDPKCLDDVRMILPRGSMFYRHSHALVYAAVLQLQDSDHDVDWVTVLDKLTANGQLEACGGRDATATYLSDISVSVPSAYAAERYAGIVRREWARREIILAAGDARSVAFDDARQDPAQEAIDLLDSRMTEIEAARETVSVTGIDEAIRQSELQREKIEEWRRHNEDALPGLSCGFTDLDELTLGFRGGELIVVGARPSQGKTAMLLGIMGEICLRAVDDEKVLLFSFEMGTVEVAQRVICQVAGVDLRDYRMGTLLNSDRGAVADATRLIRPAAYIVDHQELRVTAMRALARRVARKHELKAIFVDYLQLVRDDDRLDRHLQIGSISRGLKAMARELDVPVITAAQLNRQMENRGDSRPKLADLRESGSIENDADQVILLHRTTPAAEVSNVDCPEYSVLVEKNRNGPTGDVPFYFHKRSARFVQRSALATGAPA